jgi:hypothetical protein
LWRRSIFGRGRFIFEIMNVNNFAVLIGPLSAKQAKFFSQLCVSRRSAMPAMLLKRSTLPSSSAALPEKKPKTWMERRE